MWLEGHSFSDRIFLSDQIFFLCRKRKINFFARSDQRLVESDLEGFSTHQVLSVENELYKFGSVKTISDGSTCPE